jgi:hypothetical protein
VPAGTDLREKVGRVAVEAAVRLSEPIGNEAIAALPQNAGQAVAVEIASAFDMPTGAGIGQKIVGVAVKSAGWIGQPVGD